MGRKAKLLDWQKRPSASKHHRHISLEWYGAHGGGEEENSGDEDSRDEE